MSHAVLRRLKSIMPLPDLYYPELVGVTFVLHSPWVVHTLWSILKMLLSRELQEKTIILSPSDADTARFMQSVRPAEVPCFFNPPTANAKRAAAESQYTRAACTVMPPEVAVACGFAGLSEATLSTFYVNQDAASGYSVPRYDASGQLV